MLTLEMKWMYSVLVRKIFQMARESCYGYNIIMARFGRTQPWPSQLFNDYYDVRCTHASLFHSMFICLDSFLSPFLSRSLFRPFGICAVWYIFHDRFHSIIWQLPFQITWWCTMLWLRIVGGMKNACFCFY